MGFNIGSFGGALAGEVAEELKRTREQKEAENKAKMEKHSETINVVTRKLQPAILKDLQIKAREVENEFKNVLGVTISRPTIFKLATENYKEFEKLRREDKPGLIQYAGSASEDPTFDLQQAIELAAEEKATAAVEPFMPPEQRSFLGFKTRTGERAIEREAERLGMTAEEYKEFGAGTVPVPQVDVTLDPTVLSDVTATERQQKLYGRLSTALALPVDSPVRQKQLDFIKRQIAAIPKVAGQAKQSDVRANLKIAFDGVDKALALSSSKYMVEVPGTGRVFAGELSPADAEKIAGQYQEAVKGVLEIYLKANGLKPTGNVLNDIDRLPDDNIKLPFYSYLNRLNGQTLIEMAKNKVPTRDIEKFNIRGGAGQQKGYFTTPSGSQVIVRPSLSNQKNKDEID